MKGLGKVLIGFSVLTFTLLLYVHERVEILRASYRIDARSAELTRKAEEFRRLKFEVTQLRSPQNLEERLQELSLPLTIPQEIQILRVPEITPQPRPMPLSVRPPASKFFDFLGQWIQVAQARTDQ